MELLKNDNIIVTRMANGQTKVVLERKLKTKQTKIIL
jgi:hypothetical protein